MRHSYIIGIDEVGRGALAGPLTVGAVIIPIGFRPPRRSGLPPLRDSKRLSPRQRKIWVKHLEKCDVVSCVTARVTAGTVDRMNVSRAANIAAARACEKIIAGTGKPPTSFRVYLDGGLYLDPKTAPELEKLKSNTVVKGDEKINAIKLASIVAKVSRDRSMTRLGRRYPWYGFHMHKGYGTKKHIASIRRHGPSEIHRLTFVRNFVKV